MAVPGTSDYYEPISSPPHCTKLFVDNLVSESAACSIAFTFCSTGEIVCFLVLLSPDSS